MDEAKRMEEGLKTTYNDYHKGELKHEIERTNGNGDSIEHDKDARITQEGESVQQIVEQEQPLVKCTTTNFSKVFYIALNFLNNLWLSIYALLVYVK